MNQTTENDDEIYERAKNDTRLLENLISQNLPENTYIDKYHKKISQDTYPDSTINIKLSGTFTPPLGEHGLIQDKLTEKKIPIDSLTKPLILLTYDKITIFSSYSKEGFSYKLKFKYKNIIEPKERFFLSVDAYKSECKNVIGLLATLKEYIELAVGRRSAVMKDNQVDFSDKKIKESNNTSKDLTNKLEDSEKEKQPKRI